MASATGAWVRPSEGAGSGGTGGERRHHGVGLGDGPRGVATVGRGPGLVEAVVAERTGAGAEVVGRPDLLHGVPDGGRLLREETDRLLRGRGDDGDRLRQVQQLHSHRALTEDLLTQ